MPELLLGLERSVMVAELVDYLPALRQKVGMSQEVLGNCVGKSRQKISDIERRTAPMAWDTDIAACAALEYAGAFTKEETPWFYEAKLKCFEDPGSKV